jgi:hypothetical protein
VLVLVALLVPLLVPLLVLVPLLTAVLVLVALLVPLLVLVALLTTLLNIARSSRAISRFATNFFILILWLMYFSADISVESQNISLISAWYGHIRISLIYLNMVRGCAGFPS